MFSTMALNPVNSATTLAGLGQPRWNFLSPPPEPNPSDKIRYVLFFIYPRRWLSANPESAHPEFSGAENAYEVLGVPETSSFEVIKASFRKLAKETHPDLVDSDSGDSKRFVEILAAYEILSDHTKRAHYDQYLLATRHVLENHSRQNPSYHMYATYTNNTKQMEVVEWLRWYRYAVKDILSEKSLPGGSGYFDVLQREFYSAVHSAYFGPEIQSLDLLPDRFEAEERSVCETPEVLHLVSGRDLFGSVRIADRLHELSEVSFKKLTSADDDSVFCQPFTNLGYRKDMVFERSAQLSEKDSECIIDPASDAYKNLELHVCGRLVATASRVPPKEQKESSAEKDGEYSEDQIHVFLSSDGEPVHVKRWEENIPQGPASGTLLGTITGLGTNPDESSCYVYNSSGAKTHVILKHRTPLVKHLHWFQLADEVSICECRCTRARLPPSKYWLFEPRCSMHDIGGWYIETYGKDKRSKTIPSQRYWDGYNAYHQLEKRLHPAVYLLALAYRTLDIENGRKTKQTIWDKARGNLSKMSRWCKKLV